MQRHTMTEIVNHSRSTVLERSIKNILVVRWGGGGGGGVKSFFTWPQPSALVLAKYTQNLTSVHVRGLLLISATSPRT